MSIAVLGKRSSGWTPKSSWQEITVFTKVQLREIEAIIEAHLR